MSDLSGDQRDSLFLLLGELKQSVEGVHRALDAASQATSERMNAQSARIDQVNNRIDKIEDGHIKKIGELEKSINSIEMSAANQKGGISLATWLIPLFVSTVIGAAALAIAFYDASNDSPVSPQQQGMLDH